MYLLARDWDGAGRGSLQMSVDAVFCCTIPEIQNGWKFGNEKQGRKKTIAV
jgi:hypothetical protein